MKYRLSILLAVVTLIQTAIGVFAPQVFRDPAMTVGNAQGTDVVILFIALPVLIVSMILTKRGSLRSQITWAGSIAYIMYNAVLFTFATAFNPLFLFYVATLSLAVWSLLTLLISVDLPKLKLSFSAKTPIRLFSGYLMVISLLFLATWLKQIIPALFDPGRPGFLDGTIMLTSPVHVLDLGFTLPIGILAAVWLWQYKEWGYMLSGLLISMLTIETTSIAVDQYFGHLHDPAASPAAIPLFIGLTVIGLAVTAAYLGFSNRRPNQ